MKYLVIFMLLFSSCASKTQYGDCIGVTDDKNPKLQYQVSGWNIAMGIIFFELIVPPVVVLFNKVQCPVGTK